MEQPITSGKWEENPQMRVGKAETQSHHKPHPSHGDPQQGRNSSPESPPWEAQGLHPLLRLAYERIRNMQSTNPNKNKVTNVKKSYH